MECKYEVRYLPLFYEDLSEKLSYIENTLKNPQAARQLLEDVERAIIERLPVSECFEPYHSIKERKNPYYRIYIKNYVVYYVVLESEKKNYKIMEVRRFLYNKQNAGMKI